MPNETITIDNVERGEKSSIKLTCTAGAYETSKVYQNLLTKYGKEVRIKGFRPGKAPQNILERKFGESIRLEAENELMNKALETATARVKEKPLGYRSPVLDGEPVFVPGKDFTFTLVYDTFPEIVLGKYKELSVTEPKVKITKKDEQDELEKLRESNAIYSEKADGIVEKDSIVAIDYAELDSQGNKVNERKNFVFRVGSETHPYGIDEELLGMTMGETKVIKKIYPQDYQANTQLAGRTISLEVSLISVKERQLPDLNDEFAQDVSEEFKTLSDLKKKITSEIQTRIEAKLKQLKIHSLLDTLEADAKIEIPESMLQFEMRNLWLEYLQNSKAKEEQVLEALKAQKLSKELLMEQWRPNAEKSIRIQLILGKITELEKIEVNQQELEEEIITRAEKLNMSVEDLQKTFGGSQFKDYLKQECHQKKLYDFLLDNATVKPGDKLDYSTMMSM